jgi:hypothetical protein
VRGQCADPDGPGVIHQQRDRLLRVSFPALVSVDPIGDLATAIWLDTQFATANQGTGCRRASREGANLVIVSPVRGIAFVRG